MERIRKPKASVSRWLALLAVTLLWPIARAEGGQSGDAHVLPCSDPRGCPDLTPVTIVTAIGMVIDTRKFPTTDCSVVEGEVHPGNRRLLRFNFASANIGEGALVIGDPHNHPDLFSFVNCHNHPHLEGWASYRLWTQAGYESWLALKAANPGVPSNQLLAQYPSLQPDLTGRKQGFCIREDIPFTPDIGGPPDLDPPTYEDCATNQGIGVGWMDVYAIFNPGQWVEVSPIGGTYVLEAEVNADRQIAESNYENNTIAVCVNVPPKNGQPKVVPDPKCITPTLVSAPDGCWMCHFTCDSFGLPDADCPCLSEYCPTTCVGDCDNDQAATVDELLTMVNIALGNAQLSVCASGVPSGAAVDIPLILQAVNNALSGCGG